MVIAKTSFLVALLWPLRHISSTELREFEEGNNLVGGPNTPTDPCATVRCADPCALEPFPCGENEKCEFGEKDGCCFLPKCTKIEEDKVDTCRDVKCEDPCQTSSRRLKGSKSTKSVCSKKETCEANGPIVDCCPTATCVDTCSITKCFISDFCTQIETKCGDDKECHNVFGKNDCCPSGYQCKKKKKSKSMFQWR